jgi:two-component system LytT family response regulator
MGKKIRAVIVDDEELARQMLREFLHGHQEIEIAAECANGFEAVKAVTELKPDLVFLDIQMPKLNGFEVLELIGTDRAVIFVTAYDEYAIRAFDIHAVDYLLKPFGAERKAAVSDRAFLQRAATSATTGAHCGEGRHPCLHHPGCQAGLCGSAR